MCAGIALHVSARLWRMNGKIISSPSSPSSPRLPPPYFRMNGEENNSKKEGGATLDQPAPPPASLLTPKSTNPSSSSSFFFGLLTWVRDPFSLRGRFPLNPPCTQKPLPNGGRERGGARRNYQFRGGGGGFEKLHFFQYRSRQMIKFH